MLQRLSLTLLLLITCATAYAQSRWGADYFPAVTLRTDEGKDVRFFEDLIENRIVLINFIYTSCVDTCPLETAQLVKVQGILGERLGRDVYFYSISIDPDHDSPEVLAEYKQRFGAHWTFLTGNEADITLLRRKLGLYVEEIQDGSNNHNVNMIIGNQRTGRWMKRSPFENPYVLADQLGNWLDGWKSPQRGEDYSTAPELRSIPNGEVLFRTRCTGCHGVSGVEAADALGPDLLGVTERRDAQWLLDWLRAPNKVLEAKDPIAVALFEKYRRLPMPNMRLNEQEARDLLAYIAGQSAPDEHQVVPASKLQGTVAATLFEGEGDRVLALRNAWVRVATPGAPAQAGYLTLINRGDRDIDVTAMSSADFDHVEMHEMTTVDGMMRMRELDEVVVPAGQQVAFTPGGKHLMLIGARRLLQPGELVTLHLQYADGREQSVQVGVVSR